MISISQCHERWSTTFSSVGKFVCVCANVNIHKSNRQVLFMEKYSPDNCSAPFNLTVAPVNLTVVVPKKHNTHITSDSCSVPENISCSVPENITVVGVPRKHYNCRVPENITFL